MCELDFEKGCKWHLSDRFHSAHAMRRRCRSENTIGIRDMYQAHIFKIESQSRWNQVTSYYVFYSYVANLKETALEFFHLQRSDISAVVRSYISISWVKLNLSAMCHTADALDSLLVHDPQT